MSQWLPQLLNINVVGGAGSGVVSQGGTISAVGVIAPAGSQYDIHGEDNDGFLLYLGDDVIGNVNLAARAQVYGQHTVKISEASIDGNYKIKLWYENF